MQKKKAAKQTGRAKTPEAIFLNQLAESQSARYRAAKGIGSLFVVALVVQAWAFAHVFAELALHQSFSMLFLFLGLSALWLRAFLSFLRERVCTSASRHIRYDLRKKLLSHLTKLGPARSRIDEDAALSTRVYEQVDALDDFFSRYKPQVFMVVLIPCAILLSVAPISWIALGVFITTAPLVIVFMIFVGHKAAQANRRQFNVLAMLSNQFMDLSVGLAELKRLGKTQQAKSRLSDSSGEYQRTTMNVLYLAFLSTATLELFASLSIAMIALYLGLGLLESLPWQVGESPVPLAQAMFLLLLAPEFYLPLRQLGNDYHAKQKAEAATTDLMAIINTEIAIVRSSNLKEENTSRDNALICFENLSWQESGRQRLAAITGSIYEGERVWLSGESGIGKSSLLYLLLGFDAAYQGQLSVKGRHLSELLTCPQTLSKWRRSLAWLPQTPEWVNGSIRRNLLLGITPPTELAIEDALLKSQCDEFIKPLPDGLDTALTEIGTGLSGGQMQRLSIARALLSGAEVWLLDEPCSGLDQETAQSVLATLEQASKGKTVLVVSHDTHPIYWADKHWSLTQGGLYEEDKQAIA
ncbi:thiol reductant ABC exporter subunit CydD [Marinomonas sp. C2222]|uniref:Thiol reductant ABC exporter subunit CydD n=1 Tax=Marinomonas sargassi TaxID=2984494 RepID=A0ABT2YRS6_9GAMM|nr:thiol reductant ABC exporter subunit CydD [Marinomonas sargassi]MCV2402594.1 thiol reductant ABC exporter subunit CydD [Marinomonas sargassi]